MFPLFLLLFGANDTSKIAVATFASTLIIIFNTAHGALHMKPSRITALQIMGATSWQIYTHGIFWETLPQIFVGIKSAISNTLIIIIVTEMFIGTPTELGRTIVDAQITYEIPTVYAAILLCGIIGYALNFACTLLERRVIHWNGK